MKILDAYNSMAKEMFLEAEVDDDKIIKYKKEDGEQGEMKASSAKTMPKDHPAKVAYDKMSDSDSDDKSNGQGLSGSDFDRDNEEDDDDYNSKITARNNPHSADAFFSNPYETVQINGKKYRPIKESKKEEKTFAEIVKENSKRFAKRK